MKKEMQARGNFNGCNPALARILRPAKTQATFEGFLSLYKRAKAEGDPDLMKAAVDIAFTIAQKGFPAERMKFLDDVKLLKLRKSGKLLVTVLAHGSSSMLRNRLIEMGESVLTLVSDNMNVATRLALCGDDQIRLRLSKLSGKVIFVGQTTAAHVIGGKGPQEARENIRSNPRYSACKDIKSANGNTIEQEIEQTARNTGMPLAVRRGKDGYVWQTHDMTPIKGMGQRRQ